MNRVYTHPYQIIGIIVLVIFFVSQNFGLSEELEITESQLNEVNRAIEGYEETWRSIANQTISVVYDEECLYPSYQKNTATRLQETIKDSQWIHSKDGDRFFGKKIVIQPDTHKSVEKFCDIVYYKGQRCYLECNFNKKEALFKKTTLCGTPVKDADAVYSIVQGINNDEKSLRFPLTLLFSFSNRDKMSLKELVNSAKVVSVTTEKNNKGDNLISFKIVPLNMEGLNKDDPPHLSITINAQKSYHIEKVIYYLTNVAKKSETKKYMPIIIVKQILEYEQLPDGQFFPKIFEITNYMGTNLEDISNSYSTTLNFHSIKLHPELSNKLLGFNFPKNAIVASCKKGEKTCDVHIWGENGEPKMIFQNQQEFESFMQKECGLAPNGGRGSLPPPPHWTWLRISLMLAGIALIVSSIVINYLRKKRSQ